MNDLTTLVGTELSFETTAYPFREMFLDRVNDRFVQGRPSLSDLSQLAEIVDVQSMGPVY